MSGHTTPRPAAVAAGAAGVLLLITWVSSGSFVLAVLVVVLVAGALGLAALLVSWAAREPATDLAERVPDVVPTTDLHHAATPGARVRTAVRGLLARPWVRGDGLVRSASTKLASPDALVWTPRGQRVAAPHVWVEWNGADLAEIAARWPLEVLARELAGGYAEHVREHEVRQIAERSVLHLLVGPDVPRGRVVVTAAFSRPQRDAVVTASAPEQRPVLAPPQRGPDRGVPPRPRSRRAGPPGPPASPRTLPVPGAVRSWPRELGTRLLGRRAAGGPSAPNREGSAVP